MLNTRYLVLPFVFCAAAFVSPASAQDDPPEVKDGNYFKDRAHDVLDLFRLRGGIPDEGRSIGLKARVTTAVQVGYVAYQGPYAGMDRRAIGVFDEKRREGGISGAYGSFNEMDGKGNYFMDQDTPWALARDRRILRNLPHWDDGRRRALSCGVELATPIFALDVGVYPGEAVDLVLGFFTIDVVHDDHVDWDDLKKIQKQSTYPEPKTDAAFEGKRIENQEFLDGLKAKEAEEYEAFIQRKSEEQTAAPAPVVSLPQVDTEPEVSLTGSPKTLEEVEQSMEESQAQAEKDILEEKIEESSEETPSPPDKEGPQLPQTEGKISDKDAESALEELEKQREVEVK